LALVTVRVPEELKKQMRRLKSVNWSSVLRQAIEERVELEQRSVTKDLGRVREGSRKADAIRNEIERKYGHVDFNSAETIRYWRESRFGATSRTPR
jgi:predicted transcriptional regulator